MRNVRWNECWAAGYRSYGRTVTMGLTGYRPTFRQMIEWLDKDGCARVFCVAGHWYSRAGFNRPHLRHESLADAVDRAMQPAAETAPHWACIGERYEPPNV